MLSLGLTGSSNILEYAAMLSAREPAAAGFGFGFGFEVDDAEARERRALCVVRWVALWLWLRLWAWE